MATHPPAPWRTLSLVSSLLLATASSHLPVPSHMQLLFIDASMLRGMVQRHGYQRLSYGPKTHSPLPCLCPLHYRQAGWLELGPCRSSSGPRPGQGCGNMPSCVPWQLSFVSADWYSCGPATLTSAPKSHTLHALCPSVSSKGMSHGTSNYPSQ